MAKEGMKCLNVTIPKQIDFMVEMANMFGETKSKKEFVARTLFAAAYEKLRELGFLDATANAYKTQHGLELVHEYDKLNNKEAVDEEADGESPLDGIEASASQS